jgi:hypothetical protein
MLVSDQIAAPVPEIITKSNILSGNRFTDVSEECTASIFRVGKQHGKQAACSKHDVCYLLGILFNPDKDNNLVLQNVYEHLSGYTV